MKRMILGIGLFIVAGLFAQTNAQDAKTDAKLIAVKFHADWCGACKAIAPDFKALPDKLEGKSVSFYQFDLTNKETKEKSSELAKKIGLEKIYNDNQKTGFILVIDTKTNKVLETLTRKDDLASMQEKISKYL
ncbi:thioredoxin family protein [Perlabentimonas gracilis]|uniref:thioredoxin family protein n=1 Tax=Perlabentimonas gracilis TaxID=2715279 RepID=UPI00140AE74E|nr:thioredoxin family protein [Perlabentimonas gracilis]NHB70364.1 thioredoxin [Perlabentimonas gracilis]